MRDFTEEDYKLATARALSLHTALKTDGHPGDLLSHFMAATSLYMLMLNQLKHYHPADAIHYCEEIGRVVMERTPEVTDKRVLN